MLRPGALEGAREQSRLPVPTDERRTAASAEVDAEPRPGSDGAPCADRLRLALGGDRVDLLVVDHPLGGPVRRLPDQHAAGWRGCLQARTGVDHVTRDHPLALGRRGVERHQRLARVDADADLELERRGCLVELGDRVLDRERRTDRTLRIVLVHDRSPEHGDHGVADELLDRAAEVLELVAEPCVVGREHRADVLGVGVLRARRRSDEVREHDRDDLPLLATRDARERRPARGAVALALRALPPAPGADDHPRTAAPMTWPAPRSGICRGSPRPSAARNVPRLGVRQRFANAPFMFPSAPLHT